MKAAESLTHIMIKKIIQVVACGLLCSHAALSKGQSNVLAADSVTEANSADQLTSRLELIADSVNHVHLDDLNVTSASMLKLFPTTIAGRLAYLRNEIPFTYNEQVQSYIDIYSSDRYRRYLSRMLGLGQYYFPIYERVFAEMGVPVHIKYLSILESALNPDAVSRVGATGLWQFMFTTARMYDLKIDSYIDERKDPIAASYAAAAHLLDSYQRFGDWLLAIAAYNCGEGNVLRAIRRSGKDNPDYWDISPYLPRETRNYVPAFIAMTYMLEYHEEHEIYPEETEVPLHTEAVFVQKSVSFSGLAKVLNVKDELIKRLNPAYKRGVVNGTREMPKRLILPEVEPVAYPALYALLNQAPTGDRLGVVNASNSISTPHTVFHKVRKGETLEQIAKQYRITVQDLRVWNGIKNHVIVPGQQLQVSASEREGGRKENESAPAKYITYRVKRGDTLSDIAQKHRGATVSGIRTANALKGNTIRPGMTLKISVN